MSNTIKNVTSHIATSQPDGAAAPSSGAALQRVSRGDGAAPAGSASNSGSLRSTATNQLLGKRWEGLAGGHPQAAERPLPFFENFLEDQNRIRDGGMQTMRYPSDSDSDKGEPDCCCKPPGGGQVTMAYPSDSDRDDGGIKPPGGGMVTLAYPSDSDRDDGGIKPPGGGMVTLAYPSDSDRDAGGILQA